MTYLQKSLLLFACFNCLFVCSQNVYVISLKDKKQNQFSLTRPQEFLSKESIARRVKQGVAITETDLPVSVTYIEQLKNSGAKVTHISKWLNEVVIETTDISSIEILPFVKRVHRISAFPALKKQFNKLEALSDNEFRDFDASLFYGAAASQNEMLRVSYLHERGYWGDSVHLAMFDSGFRNIQNIRGFDSAFLNNRVLEKWDYVANNDSLFFVASGSHGTSTMSCIAANEPNKMVGTSPNVWLSLFRTEDAEVETIEEEYNWLAAAEHADSAGAQIFSTSLGYTTFDNNLQNHAYADLDGHSTLITRAANAAAHAGIVVINSAGNEGNGSWHYIAAPADGDSVLAVGAVNGDRLLADFSSRGPNSAGKLKPDVCAQGANVAVYDPSGNVYASNGTSFSCPILAGAVACLMQAFPDAKNMEIMEAVTQSAHLFKTPNNDYGYGIPDMAIAYWLLNEKYPKTNNATTFRVYPNPFLDQLNIYLESSALTNETLVIDFFDISGKLAYSEKKYFAENNHFFSVENLSSLRKGVYLLRIKGNAIYEVIRVEKQ